MFSVERLQTHARSLALAQPVASPTTRGLPLAPRLAKNGEALLSAYQSIVKAIDEGRALTPAAEWLIDNYHLVEKQIRQIQMDLPPGYYRQLPKLVTGPFAGYPRVFGIAWAFVAHTDSCFEAEILVSYINAYQEIQPLTIGELWAVSITLQIVLIENLRRLAQRITQSRIARHEADAVADRLLGVSGQAAEPASKVFAGRGAGPLSEEFAVQLVHRLRDQDPKVTPALAWLDERLARQDLTADSAVREVHRSQGAANVTVRNIVTSLRVISEVDWRELFERFCLVDGAFMPESSFQGNGLFNPHALPHARSRNWRGGRAATNWISRASRRPRRASQIPRSTSGRASAAREPGLLFARRRAPRIRDIDRVSQMSHLARTAQAGFSFDVYAAAIVVVSACLLAAPLIALAQLGLSFAELGLLAALGAISAIDAGVALVNRAFSFLFARSVCPAWSFATAFPNRFEPSSPCRRF